MKRGVIILFLSIIIGNIASYASDNSSKVNILRFDKDLYAYISDPNKAKETDLQKKYPNLLPVFAQTITGSSSNSLDALKGYFSHPELKKIYSEAINHFDNLNSYENGLQDALSNVFKELGTTKSPTFAVHISGFKENVIYVNNIISLSLDKYMGVNYPTYKRFFSAEQIAQMKPEYITRDYIKAWLMADFIKTESTNGNLLQEIIEQGKLLYALKIILSHTEEKDLLGFDDQQYNLCLANQKAVWNNLIKNRLYSTDRQEINYLFEYRGIAPSGSSSIKIPHNIGGWIGLQIVAKYATETKSTLKEILKTDEKTILRKSKYSPE